MNKNSIRYALIVIAIIGGFTLINGQACSPMQAMDGADDALYSDAAFALSPPSQTIGTGATLQMVASGGTGPYTYTVIGGGGTITSTGVFTAPSTITGISSFTTISAQDELGQVATANITVTPGTNGLPVTYSPNPALPNEAIALIATGGVAPYTYTLLSGSGTLLGTVYNAPSISETAQIQVVDSSGLSGLATITIGSGGVGVYSTSGGYVLAVSMTGEGTHVPGGNGCGATSQQAGLVTDVGGSWSGYQDIYGDQSFCATYGSPTVGAQVVTNIQVTAEGYHSNSGIGCPSGYSQIGDVGDCSGGYCQGNQQVCVATASYTSGMQTVQGFYITPANAHNLAPVCNSGYTQVGSTSDCGYGTCYGLQLFCVLY